MDNIQKSKEEKEQFFNKLISILKTGEELDFIQKNIDLISTLSLSEKYYIASCCFLEDVNTNAKSAKIRLDILEYILNVSPVFDIFGNINQEVLKYRWFMLQELIDVEGFMLSSINLFAYKKILELVCKDIPSQYFNNTNKFVSGINTILSSILQHKKNIWMLPILKDKGLDIFHVGDEPVLNYLVNNLKEAESFDMYFKYLLENGLDVHVCDIKGENAYFYFVRSLCKNESIIKKEHFSLLETLEVSSGIINHEENTILHFILRENYNDINVQNRKLLCEFICEEVNNKRINPSIKDKNGCVAIHFANLSWENTWGNALYNCDLSWDIKTRRGTGIFDIILRDKNLAELIEGLFNLNNLFAMIPFKNEMKMYPRIDSSIIFESFLKSESAKKLEKDEEKTSAIKSMIDNLMKEVNNIDIEIEKSNTKSKQLTQLWIDWVNQSAEHKSKVHVLVKEAFVKKMLVKAEEFCKNCVDLESAKQLVIESLNSHNFFEAQIIKKDEVIKLIEGLENKIEVDSVVEERTCLLYTEDEYNKYQTYVDGAKNLVNNKEFVKKVSAGIYTPLKTFAKSDVLLQKIEELREQFPHFSEVINHIENHCILQNVGDGTFFIPPLLLAGGPGIGKTFFCNTMAELVATHFHVFNMESMSSNGPLTGAAEFWGTAMPGSIFTILRDEPKINPIFLLDELDKAKGDSRYSPEAALLPLLERYTAEKFKDECITLPINASHCIWIATANELKKISAPIQSRFDIFTVPNPTFSQRKNLIGSVFKSILKNNSWGKSIKNELSDEILNLLAGMISPGAVRDLRRNLTTACAKAVKDKRDYILLKDINAVDQDTKMVWDLPIENSTKIETLQLNNSES